MRRGREARSKAVEARSGPSRNTPGPKPAGRDATTPPSDLRVRNLYHRVILVNHCSGVVAGGPGSDPRPEDLQRVPLLPPGWFVPLPGFWKGQCSQWILAGMMEDPPAGVVKR